MRTFDSGGIAVLTFTPLKGISEVVKQQIGNVKIDETFPHIIKNEFGALVRISMYDVPHLANDDIEALKGRIPEHQHLARIEGIPTVGEGLIFPFSRSQLEMSPFVVPPHWQVVDAVDFGTQYPTTRMRVYMDPDREAFYLTQVYRSSDLSQLQHAALWSQEFKGAVPVAWPRDGKKRLDDLDAEGLIALADCLSPLKLCDCSRSSGVYGDGTKETFRRRYSAVAS